LINPVRVVQILLVYDSPTKRIVAKDILERTGEAEHQRLDLQIDRPLTVQRTMTRTWTNFKAGVL